MSYITSDPDVGYQKVQIPHVGQSYIIGGEWYNVLKFEVIGDKSDILTRWYILHISPEGDDLGEDPYWVNPDTYDINW